MLIIPGGAFKPSAASGVETFQFHANLPQTILTLLTSNGGRVQCMKVAFQISRKQNVTMMINWAIMILVTRIFASADPALDIKLCNFFHYGVTEQPMQHGFEHPENHRSPGYYNGRYWVMWKLPMFGCTDSFQVLKLERAWGRQDTSPECVHICIIGFDNKLQARCISFHCLQATSLQTSSLTRYYSFLMLAGMLRFSSNLRCIQIFNAYE